MKHSRAFTLLEVIISITIILILAALIISSLSGVKLSSKATVSIQNMRQIHTAMLLYEADHGAMPPSVGWPAFVEYTGGEIIKPPLATKREHWYFMLAVPTVAMPPADQECMAKRGESYPVLHDANFARPEIAKANEGGFYLYTRRDGSIGRVSSDIMYDALRILRIIHVPVPVTGRTFHKVDP